MKFVTRVNKISMRCVQPASPCSPSVSELVGELKEAMKHEDNDSISLAEDTDIQNGSRWSDNNSNISKWEDKLADMD